MQVDWFLQTMKNEYKAIWTVLTTAKTVREASNAVLLKFERPADQSEAVQVKRAGYGQTYFDKYAASTPATEQPAVLDEKYAKYINSTSTHYISNSGSDERSTLAGRRETRPGRNGRCAPGITAPGPVSFGIQTRRLR